MNSLKIVLPLSLALFSAGALAAAPKFDALDVNQNDRIEMKEAEKSPELARAFRDLDVDEDGTLSRNEFSKFETDQS